MLQKENNFTGFIAYYGPKKKVFEKENYTDKSGNKKATNWSEIDKEKLTALELVWRGSSKILIKKSDYPHMQGTDWFFTQSAFLDMATQKIRVVARNIGYRKEGIIQIFTVEEDTGTLKSSVRNV